eukprot:TRINITY_DN1228_c0_g1_i4.p1 TRINITY_DN1228_c0_g1~~TRINITY_DN1228_c0_g1_i4.p1  ORF type:complete len:177 (+),score=5.57 TRINITY_DN1228_c0_g1_i4:613-1143(+)
MVFTGLPIISGKKEKCSFVYFVCGCCRLTGLRVFFLYGIFVILTKVLYLVWFFLKLRGIPSTGLPIIQEKKENCSSVCGFADLRVCGFSVWFEGKETVALEWPLRTELVELELSPAHFSLLAERESLVSDCTVEEGKKVSSEMNENKERNDKGGKGKERKKSFIIDCCCYSSHDLF